MMPEFLVRAALAGIGLSLAAGPLGAFVVWRRLAYFGDAISHAAVLGVALALALSLPVLAATVAVTVLTGLSVAAMTARGQSGDSVLGVLAHSALALGLVGLSLVPGVRADIEAILFGDILAVSASDVAAIWIGAGLVLVVLAWRWQRLLTATLSGDLAQSEGIDPERETVLLTLLLALTVAMALKVVGALLIGALLIIPAAAARNLARSPEGMAAIGALLGATAVLGGLALSLWADTPSGASIVTIAAALYAGSLLARRRPA